MICIPNPYLNSINNIRKKTNHTQSTENETPVNYVKILLSAVIHPNNQIEYITLTIIVIRYKSVVNHSSFANAMQITALPRPKNTCGIIHIN